MLLTEWFTNYPEPFVGNDKSITTQLQYAQQCVRATILNTQAEVIESNMRYAYRGMGFDDEVAWMRGSNKEEGGDLMWLIEEASPMRQSMAVSDSEDEDEESDDEEGGAATTTGTTRPAAEPGWTVISARAGRRDGGGTRKAVAPGRATSGGSAGGGRRDDRGAPAAAGGRDHGRGTSTTASDRYRVADSGQMARAGAGVGLPGQKWPRPARQPASRFNGQLARPVATAASRARGPGNAGYAERQRREGRPAAAAVGGRPTAPQGGAAAGQRKYGVTYTAPQSDSKDEKGKRRARD